MKNVAAPSEIINMLAQTFSNGLKNGLTDVYDGMKDGTLIIDDQVAAMQELNGQLSTDDIQNYGTGVKAAGEIISASIKAEAGAHGANTAALTLETAAQQALNVAKKAALGLIGSIISGLAVGAITAGITKIVEYVQSIKTPAEEAAEALESVRSELDSAESDVDEIQSKIDELNETVQAAGVESIEDIVDPEERAKLETTNNLLQAQLKLKQQLADIKGNDANDAAANVINTVIEYDYDSPVTNDEGILTGYEGLGLPESINKYSTKLDEITEKRNELVESNTVDEANDKEIEALDEQASEYLEKLDELTGQLPEWETEASNIGQYTDEQNRQTTATENATNAINAYNNSLNGTADAVENTNLDILTEKIERYKDKIEKNDDGIVISLDVDTTNADLEVSEWMSNFESGGVFEGWSKEDILDLADSGTATSEQAEALQELRKAAAESGTDLSGLLGVLQNFGYVMEDTVATTKDLTTKWEEWNTETDAIQSAYSTMTQAQEEYNKYGYLSIDTLQSMLSLDSKYWAAMDITNGKISLNTQAYELLTQAQYENAVMLAAEQYAQNLANAVMDAGTTATENQITAQNNMKSKLAEMIPAWNSLTASVQEYIATALLAQGFKVTKTNGNAVIKNPSSSTSLNYNSARNPLSNSSSGNKVTLNNSSSTKLTKSEAKLTKDGVEVTFDSSKVETYTKAFQNQLEIINSGLKNVDSGLNNQLSGFDSGSSSASDSANQLSNNLGELSGNLETLTNAAKEYNAYGAISISTMNDLYGLSDEYTSCLVEQDGQLRVSTDSFLALLQAEINQAAAAEAAGDSDGENAKSAAELQRIYDLLSASAKGTTISIEELTDIINGFGASLDDAQEKASNFQSAVSGIKSVSDNLKEANSSREVKNSALAYDDLSDMIDTMQSIKDDPDLYSKLYQNGELTTDENVLKSAAIEYLNDMKDAAYGDSNMIALLDKEIENLNEGLISGTDFWHGYNTQLEEAQDVISDANDSIDSYQDAWSTLNDVVDEYNRYGYITQDSYQDLINLDDKYLVCLEEEEGQLKLNREAFIQLYTAELELKAVEMEEKAATLEANGATEQSTRILREAAATFRSMANDVATGCVSIEDHLEGAGTAVDKLKDKFSALKSIVSSVWGLITDTIDDDYQDQIDALEDQKEAIEDAKEALEDQKEALEDQKEEQVDALNDQKEALEDAKEALEDQKEALQDANDEEERAIELAKLQDALAKAQHSRTVRTYTSNGYEWLPDQEAIKDAEQDLSDQLREWNLEDEEEAIQDQIDAIDDQIDAIDDQIEAIEDAIDAEIEALEDQIDLLDDQIDAIDDQIDAVQDLKDAYDEQVEAAEDFIDKLETIAGIIENIGDLFGVDIWQQLYNWIFGGKSSSSSSNIASGIGSTLSSWIQQALGVNGTDEESGLPTSTATDKIGSMAGQTLSKMLGGDSTTEVIQTETNKAESILDKFANNVKTKFTNLGSSLKTLASNTKTGIQNAFSGIGNFFGNIGTGISNTFSNVWSLVKNGASTCKDSILNFFGDSGFLSGIKNAGANIVQFLSNGLNGAGSFVSNACSTVWSWITSAFSDSSFLSNVFNLGKNIVSWLSNGISNGGSILSQGLSALGSFFTGGATTGTSSGVGNVISTGLNTLGSVITKGGGTIATGVTKLGSTIVSAGKAGLTTIGGFFTKIGTSLGLVTTATEAGTAATTAAAGVAGAEAAAATTTAGSGIVAALGNPLTGVIVAALAGAGLATYGAATIDGGLVGWDYKTDSNGNYIYDSDGNKVKHSGLFGTTDDVWDDGYQFGDFTKHQINQVTKEFDDGYQFGDITKTLIHSLTFGLFASGTKDAPEGLANVDEEGQEIIVRKPQSGRFTYLETGDGVVPADITERLFEMGGDPSGWFAEQYDNVSKASKIDDHSVSNSTSIGNVYITNPVGDTETLANDIIRRLPNVIQQRRSKR